MSKQPYIPLYTGDYLKDTRVLSLSAKGAWIDLIVFMWVSEERGVLTGTKNEFARMVGATPDEFASILLELCSKKICDKEDDGRGNLKIICRRLVREAEISVKKAVNGSKGGSKTQANKQAKTKQNTDIDIDNGIGSIVKVGDTKEKNWVVVKQKYANEKNYMIYGVDGLREYLETSHPPSKLTFPEHAKKFMMEKDGNQFDDLTHLKNAYSLYVKNQFK